jgi:hypothetical protein
MNPIGAALLLCAAAGCAWAAWVSLRGQWRLVVIALSVALAVVVPLAQLGGSTATSGHAAPPPSTPVGDHELSPAAAVEARTRPVVAESAVEGRTRPVVAESAVEAGRRRLVAQSAVEAGRRPVVPESAVGTAVGPVLAELAVAPVAVEALPVRADSEAQLGDEPASRALSEVQPRSEPHRDALQQAGTVLGLPPAVDGPVALSDRAAVPSRVPAGHGQKKPPPGQEHKKAPRGQEQAKNAKPAPGAQGVRH